jgi:CheY-like chemotaxis protein
MFVFMSSILILDDEPLVRMTLEELIRADGHRPFVASDGPEAMTLFLREDIDLVFCDIVLPSNEGMQTIAEMKRAKPGVPVIAISGAINLDGLDVLELAEKLGADDSLRKPFGRPELAEVLGRFLGAARAQR